jgi:hypothetical protein
MLNKFIKLLVPSIERRELLSQVDTVSESIKDTVLPAYKSALNAGLFNKSYKLKSDWALRRESEFNIYAALKTGSMVECIVHSLDVSLKHLAWLRSKIETDFEDKVFSAGINYPKANMLQLFEAISFQARFAREFLLALYAFEVPSYWKDMGHSSLPYSDHDIRRIEKDFASFCMVLSVLTNTKSLQADFEKIPDVLVDVNDKSGAAATIGANKLMPVTLGFVNPEWNPAFRIGRWWADRQVRALKKAQAEKLALDYYLIQLKNSRDGKANAAIDKQIENVSEQIKKLSFEIQQKEEEYTM